MDNIRVQVHHPLQQGLRRAETHVGQHDDGQVQVHHPLQQGLRH